MSLPHAEGRRLRVLVYKTMTRSRSVCFVCARELCPGEACHIVWASELKGTQGWACSGDSHETIAEAFACYLKELARECEENSSIWVLASWDERHRLRLTVMDWGKNERTQRFVQDLLRDLVNGTLVPQTQGRLRSAPEVGHGSAD
jgi:hypothetical protein